MQWLYIKSPLQTKTNEKSEAETYRREKLHKYTGGGGRGACL